MIGTALADGLRGDGHDVVGVSRSPGPATVEWDVERGEIDGGALEGLDAVVHLAGESIQGRWTSAKKERILRSRVESTELLARTIAELDDRPRVFVSGSAMGYYGDRGSDVLSESAAAGSGFLAEVTQAWEAAAEPIAGLGVRLSFARTSIVLSPDGGALQRMKWITRFGLGGPLGDGQQYWSWITLSDQVRALRFMIDADLEGPVNLAAPGAVPQRTFAKELATALHRPAVIPAPGFAIRAVLGEMGDALLLDSTRLAPDALAAAGFVFDSPDVVSAFGSLFPA